MSILTSKLSKQVGWDGPVIEDFPSKEDVKESPEIQLLRLYRFLRSPKTANEEEIAKLIYDMVMK